MTADLFVVHLVSRGVAGARSGWDTPNGTVHHEVVSWSRSPATLSQADIVVAHGLAPLVVAQAIVGAGPRLVYRPVGATRANRRRLQRGLRADWIAAPSRRTGRTTASAMGLDRTRVTVFRSDDRASWDALTAELLERGPAASNLPEAPQAIREPIALLPPRTGRVLGLAIAGLAPTAPAPVDPDVGGGPVAPVAQSLPAPTPEATSPPPGPDGTATGSRPRRSRSAQCAPRAWSREPRRRRGRTLEPGPALVAIPPRRRATGRARRRRHEGATKGARTARRCRRSRGRRP